MGGALGQFEIVVGEGSADPGDDLAKVALEIVQELDEQWPVTAEPPERSIKVDAGHGDWKSAGPRLRSGQPAAVRFGGAGRV